MSRSSPASRRKRTTPRWNRVALRPPPESASPSRGIPMRPLDRGRAASTCTSSSTDRPVDVRLDSTRFSRTPEGGGPFMHRARREITGNPWLPYLPTGLDDRAFARTVITPAPSLYDCHLQRVNGYHLLAGGL